jgi:hypothetical protein
MYPSIEAVKACARACEISKAMQKVFVSYSETPVI